MDRTEARRVLREQLQLWRTRSWLDLREEVGQSCPFDVTTDTGSSYYGTVQVLWDDRPDGAIRVMASLEEGVRRVFIPLTDEFILAPDGTFVGEKRAVFTTQGQAKRFFVDKIIAQAAIEGTPLSDAERWMLSFSESDPEFVVDPEIVSRLQGEISDEDYEAKVAGLIERSWERDVAADDDARNLYREAFRVLNQGDHYVLIMIQQALGRHVGAWWAFWR